MLRGDLAAMRPVLQWRRLLLMLLSGLLLGCGGAADSSSLPPTSPTVRPVTTVSPTTVIPASMTTLSPTSAPGAPTGKPTTLPTSPVVVQPSKMLPTGASSSTTAPSLPTKPGDPATTVASIASATVSRAPTVAPTLSLSAATSSGGVAVKATASTSRPSTPALSSPMPSSAKPVGSTAGKSPGATLIPTKTSAVTGMAGAPTTVVTAKSGTTSQDQSPTSATLPKTLPTTTMPKSAGTPGSTTARSSGSSLSARPELKTTPSTLPSATSAPKEPRVPSPSSRTNLTLVQGQTKIVCENKMPPKEKAVILTLNESRPCNSLEGSPLREALAEVLCKALKPNYDQSRDDCTIRVASDPEDLKRVAVVQASVQTHSEDKDLSEALAAKKADLEKLGVHNITYGGQALDAEPKDHLSLPLIITIICMAASLLLVAAVYGCCHQRISQRKDQRLTEELHTIENGYHDNPTLEVMETLSEMQEKKVNLNGELGDSWIVPMDSLAKEEPDEEEDTHL